MRHGYVGFIALVIFVLLAGCLEPENGTPPSSSVGEPSSGWIGEDSFLVLTATDGGSGVNATYYRTWFDNVWSSWIVYTTPFNLTGEGTHYVEFFSDDMVGNIETINNATFDVDSTPPVTIITVEEPPGTLYVGKLFFDGNETVNCSKLIFVPGLDVEIHCDVINIETGLVEWQFTELYYISDPM